MSHVDPSREHWAVFKSLPRDTPVHMLNLIRYRDTAAYPEGHPAGALGWTGAQAFAEYVRRLLPIVERLGGGMVWDGAQECLVTGPDRFEWDRVFVMGFPDSAAFMALVTDPEYRADVVVHRTAAVADSRLVRCAG